MSGIVLVPENFSLFHSLSIFLTLSPDQLKVLVSEAESRGLTFVYALSPGQDIVFSSSCDLTLLKRKLRQVSKLTCFSHLVSHFILIISTNFCFPLIFQL